MGVMTALRGRIAERLPRRRLRRVPPPPPPTLEPYPAELLEEMERELQSLGPLIAALREPPQR